MSDYEMTQQDEILQCRFLTQSLNGLYEFMVRAVVMGSWEGATYLGASLHRKKRDHGFLEPTEPEQESESRAGPCNTGRSDAKRTKEFR